MEKVKLDVNVRKAVEQAIIEALRQQLQIPEDYDITIGDLEVSAWMGFRYERLVEVKE